MLTLGEKLFVWRRRGNMSQKNTADYYGYTQPAIRLMELDRVEMPASLYFEVDRIPDIVDEEHFMAAILRRRAGLSMRDVELESGISAREIGAMERGRERMSMAYRDFIKNL